MSKAFKFKESAPFLPVSGMIFVSLRVFSLFSLCLQLRMYFEELCTPSLSVIDWIFYLASCTAALALFLRVIFRAH